MSVAERRGPQVGGHEQEAPRGRSPPMDLPEAGSTACTLDLTQVATRAVGDRTGGGCVWDTRADCLCRMGGMLGSRGIGSLWLGLLQVALIHTPPWRLGGSGTCVWAAYLPSTRAEQC